MRMQVSENGQISVRQRSRMQLLEILGIMTIVIPQWCAQNAGQKGVWAIVIGTVEELLFLKIQEKREVEEKTKIIAKTAVWITKAKEILFLAICITAAAKVLEILTDLVKNVLLQEGDFEMIAISILAVAIYGSSRGKESGARVYEVLYPFLIVAFGIMLLFSIGDVRSERWCLGRNESWKTVWIEAQKIFFLYQIITISGQDKKEGIRYQKAVQRATLVGGIVLTIVYLILVGIFGNELLGRQKYSVVILMSMIEFPGDFLKRQDTYMTAFWFFTLFALLHALLQKARETGKDLCESRAGIIYGGLLVTVLCSVLWQYQEPGYAVRLTWVTGGMAGAWSVCYLIRQVFRKEKRKN